VDGPAVDGPAAGDPTGGGPAVDTVFFATPTDLRQWFAANHETAAELWLGMYKVGSGRPSVTWPQAVDEALCVGWIDGIRKGIDDISYRNRFTPRRKGSIWSAVNIARVQALDAEGRMQPAGLRAFAAREAARSAIYSYEQAPITLDEAAEAPFRANVAAWDWFQHAAPSYRNAAIHWVMTAKKPETQARRLEALITDSAAGRTVSPLTSPTRSRSEEPS
jgi:uncharacterized protein YdeI (YjbR/CyaY-like superfamily)